MLRQIVHIDREKCNGCGACARACHESAIGMVDGKAQLLRDDYCDGMGDCLPECPTGAITFEERDTLAYDEAAVKANQEKMREAKQEKIREANQEKMKQANQENAAQNNVNQSKMNLEKSDQNKKDNMFQIHQGGGCPGSRVRQMTRPASVSAMTPTAPVATTSQLQNWPVQIKLAPITAPYFNGAKLLIAADCTAYSYANFHQEFIKGKVTLIGCPKLDMINYSEKLTDIIANNDIKSVTIVRMEVPCCGGLEMAAKKALQASGKFIPWQVVTISIDGKILD